MNVTTSSITPASFNPQDFFSLAGSMVGDPNANEAALRSAISRAYYALFLVARDRLFGQDQIQLTKPRRKQIDKELRSHYGGKRDEPLHDHERVILAVGYKTRNITLYQQLGQLREARVNADYKMNHACLITVGKTTWRDYAEGTMQLASQVLPYLKNLHSY